MAMSNNPHPSFDTQVCLVSEQAIPNLTPALAQPYRPACVVLVVSDDSMAQRAEWLKNILAGHGMKVVIRRLSDAVNYVRMTQDFQRIVTDFPNAALNATGGKKTMTLAAFEAFREAGRPIFYVERDNRLHWLSPARPEGFPLAAELTMTELLAAYGQTVDSWGTPVSGPQVAMAQALFCESRRWAQPLVSLEFLGEGEEKTIGSRFGTLTAEQRKLLELASTHGLVSQRSGQWISGKSAASFLTGGWLEQHISQAVKKMARRHALQDVCHSLKIHATNNPEVRNEIDVAFVHENRLFIIECKAIKPRARSKSLADFLYTLESVRKNGGLAARAALLTWGAEPGAGDRARAEDNRILLLSGKTLNNLETTLELWIGTQ
jgi:hypothetical protein